MEMEGIIAMVDKFYTKLNNEISKKIAGLGSSGLIPTPNGSNNDNDPNHPSHWTDDQYRNFAKRWISEFAHMASWKDNPKAGPPFAADKDRAAKLGEFPEAFLQECVRYQTTADSIDYWLKLTPEQRYQKQKKNVLGHECSVYLRYGNSYWSPDKTGCSSDKGCIEECRYYLDIGSISDEEVLSWYRDVIGDRDYQTLRRDNEQFLSEFASLLRKQAQQLPTGIPCKKDYYQEYYPSIMVHSANIS